MARSRLFLLFVLLLLNGVTPAAAQTQQPLPTGSAAPTTTATTTLDPFKVTSLPGLPPKDLAAYGNWAGLIDVDASGKGGLFFWLITPPDPQPEKRPLVVWLQGGPICSSSIGLFMEHGPYVVENVSSTLGSAVLSRRSINWIDNAGVNVLYLDQPVAAGFSWAASSADWSRDETALSLNAVQFLVKFFEHFPSFRVSDLYITGESYAGQYVPNIASAILDFNKNAGSGNASPIRLKGIGLADSKTDPTALYASLIPYADAKRVWPSNSTSRTNALAHLETCLQDQKKDLRIYQASCELLLGDISEGSKPIYGPCGVNVYDITVTDNTPNCTQSFPPTMDIMASYMSLPAVAAALNANNSGRVPSWDLCTPGASESLNNETSKPSNLLLPKLLESGVRVLVFSGSNDLLCNPLSQEFAVGNLTWLGNKGFTPASSTVDFILDDGTKAGTVRTERNVTLVEIFGASHLAPYNKPEAAAEMLKRFVEGKDVAKPPITATTAAVQTATTKPNSGHGKILEEWNWSRTAIFVVIVGSLFV